MSREVLFLCFLVCLLTFHNIYKWFREPKHLLGWGEDSSLGPAVIVRLISLHLCFPGVFYVDRFET